MEAIVLAGGFGTRLQQIVPDLPKPMAPIGERPFLEILMTLLSRKGVQRVVLSLGYKADKVVSYFGGKFAGMELVYEIEKTPLGTGGALRRAMNRCKTDHVFIFNGDTYLDLDVQKVEQQWHQNRSPIIVAREVPDTARYGRLDVSGDYVAGFAEKGMAGPGLINAGCYVFPCDILNGFSMDVPFSLENDFLMKAVTRQQFEIYVTNGHFIDIGVPEDYTNAQIELAQI